MGNCLIKCKSYLNYDKKTEETKEEINNLLSQKEISKVYDDNYLFGINHTIR